MLGIFFFFLVFINNIRLEQKVTKSGMSTCSTGLMTIAITSDVNNGSGQNLSAHATALPIYERSIG